MTEKVLIVLHQEQSTPGRVGYALRQRGYELDIRRPRFGDPLPKTMADHAGAVIFGGPQSANDPDDFIKAEIDWIGVPLRDQKPYLGICLGAQMLARHMGQRVFTHPEGKAEVGYYPVRPTAATGCCGVAHALSSSIRSARHSAGNSRVQISVMTSVPALPTNTAGTAPIHDAIAPARNSPSWFDAPTNKPFTAVTRPRTSSGVPSCTSVMRITTLTISDAPSTISAANAMMSELESAKTIVARPYAITATKSFL